MHKLFPLFLFLGTITPIAQDLKLRDTTFNVNSRKVRYREYLEHKSEDKFSYDTNLVRLDINSINDSIFQVIELKIYAIGSPLNTKDVYSILADSGITLDYNFDGFEDLALRVENGAGHNALNGYFLIFLFDSVTNKFDKYKEELTNPIPYPDKKVIECSYVLSTSGEHVILERYKWENKELINFENIEYEFISICCDKKDALYKVIKTFFFNGKETRKEESILKASEMSF